MLGLAEILPLVTLQCKENIGIVSENDSAELASKMGTGDHERAAHPQSFENGDIENGDRGAVEKVAQPFWLCLAGPSPPGARWAWPWKQRTYTARPNGPLAGMAVPRMGETPMPLFQQPHRHVRCAPEPVPVFGSRASPRFRSGATGLCRWPGRCGAWAP